MLQSTLKAILGLFLILFGLKPQPMELTSLNVYPRYGSERQTHFVWVAVVDSPDEKPELTLWVQNRSYVMQTESLQSPWIFTLRSQLGNVGDLPYWIEAKTDTQQLQSPEQSLTVTQFDPDAPVYLGFLTHPYLDEVKNNLFLWEALFDAKEEPMMDLFLVDSTTGHVSSHTMAVSEFDSDWLGTAQLHLERQTTYWVLAQTGELVESSEIASVEIH